MSYDPYSPHSDEPPFADIGNARARVQPPAICLIVAGVLNLLMAAGPAFYGTAATNVSPEQLEVEMRRSNPQAVKDMETQGWNMVDIRNMLIYGSFSWAGADFLASLLVILGGVRMMSLKNYGLAVFASILAALPIVSCSGCCGLGQIAGIWALVVLLSTDVRAAFR